MAALAIPLLVAACGNQASQTSDGDTAPQERVAVEAGPDGGYSTDSSGSLADAQQQSVADDRDVVRTANLTMVGDDPKAVADQISAIAEGAKGYVQDLSAGGGACDPYSGTSTTGTPDYTTNGGVVAPRPCLPSTDGGAAELVTMTVRVPSASYDDVLASIGELGDVRSVTSNADDVTAATQDIAARIKAQQASVNRLTQLMDRADTVTDLVAIEKELSSRQAELESLQARQKTLADSVALATITATVVSPERADSLVPEEPHWWDRPWNAFWTSWEQLILVAAALLPIAIVAALIAGAVIWIVRRRRGKDSDAAAAAPVEDAPRDPPEA
jgi:hypothetical protein